VEVLRATTKSQIHDMYKPAKLHNNQKGFTLIEILVSLGIIGLLFSFGFVSFREFSRRQALSGAAKILQGDLRLTQANAMSGVKPDSAICNPPNILNSYSFTVVSSTEYRVEAECSGNLSSGSVLVKSTVLPDDVAVSMPSVNPVRFKVLGQGNNIPAGTNVTITLTQAGTGNTIVVAITSGGEIK
jgi:prepilin-type N-terminal cleavage/methylation domain-containing protein